MSEKQFDHIENRIRKAAENSEPDFDEHAWKLMEARLDKEDNKKYRFLLWPILLPLILLTAGTIYLFTGKTKDGQLNQQTQIKQKTGITTSKDNPNIPGPIAASPSASNGKNGTQAELDKKPVNAKNLNPAGKQLPNMVEEKLITIHKGIDSKKLHGNKHGNITSRIKSSEVGEDVETAGDRVEEKPSQHLPNSSLVKDADAKMPGANVAVADKKDRAENTDSASNSIAKNEPTANGKPKGTRDKKTSRFYFLAAIGADAGSVKFLSLKDSKVVPKYGVGIGYQLTKQLSIQTGFYASWKKYIAGPDDYKTKYGTYWDTVKILKVDASCLVYDIPITLRYNFVQSAKSAFYATAGISSFIMKQEDYFYHFDDYAGYHAKSKTYTGNKSLFAVFGLSAGIEKKISSNFSILAEPSIGIPLGGVGEGSVKLYSTALQLGLKYSPAKKKK